MIHTGLNKRTGVCLSAVHWQLHIQPIRYIGCPVVRNESDVRGARRLPAGHDPVHGCAMHFKARAVYTWLSINHKQGWIAMAPDSWQWYFRPVTAPLAGDHAMRAAPGEPGGGGIPMMPVRCRQADWLPCPGILPDKLRGVVSNRSTNKKQREGEFDARSCSRSSGMTAWMWDGTRPEWMNVLQMGTPITAPGTIRMRKSVRWK